jgi:hypothetical protein
MGRGGQMGADMIGDRIERDFTAPECQQIIDQFGQVLHVAADDPALQQRLIARIVTARITVEQSSYAD